MCTILESLAQLYLPGGQVGSETWLPRTRTHLPRASGQELCRAPSHSVANMFPWEGWWLQTWKSSGLLCAKFCSSCGRRSGLPCTIRRRLVNWGCPRRNSRLPETQKTHRWYWPFRELDLLWLPDKNACTKVLRYFLNGQRQWKDIF